ncbi:hypothetical protein JW707_04280 [Candidatus Woesearchaeota archaeon]|nr:hypothetical protein [Candidatus Woesearchaeota archaeon]
MGKFIKYVAAGILLAYAAHGGCDRNIDDVLEDKYSTPLIATRRVVVDYIYKKAGQTYAAIEKESKKLEEKVEEDAK